MSTRVPVFILLLPAVFLPAVSPAAQQGGKLFRIGFLDLSTASGMRVLIDAFKQEMSRLGWVEGKNIAIEYRFAEQKPERLPALARKSGIGLPASDFSKNSRTYVDKKFVRLCLALLFGLGSAYRVSMSSNWFVRFG